MLIALGKMQIVLESKPKAYKQVEAAIHHFELACTAEGIESDKERPRP